MTTAVGTMTAGIGIDHRHVRGQPGKESGRPDDRQRSSLTGTSPTLAVAETTPGVNPTFPARASAKLVVDETNAKLYINTGTALSQTWTVAGH